MTVPQPKIAILHDAFLYRGGGERLVTLMAKALDADLVSGFFSEGSFDPRELGFTGRMIPLGKPVFAKGLRHMILKWRFFWNARILREYDIVIFSGDCLGALRHIREDAQTIYYCHTPPRYLYDFRTKYLASLPLLLRPIFTFAFRIFARIYERHIREFDHIFTNSQNVHDRLLSFCDLESEILYPPTDIESFAPIPQPIPLLKERVTGTDSPSLQEKGLGDEDYFLSFARLSPPKRVDIIIDAFLMMPTQNLIFTYGKNDPMKDEILKKIEGKEHIRAIESPNDADLIALIQGATATIYIPIDEDFGMSPVESMACGTPVIGVDEGGLKETIIQNITGKLIDITDSEGGVEKLRQVISSTQKEEWNAMRESCIRRAFDFSLEKFEKKLKSSLHINL